MKLRSYSSIAIACTLLATPSFAFSQEVTTNALARRVEQLEKMNADLERRVRELEAAIKSVPVQSRANPATTRWKEIANWRRLREEMNMDEVRVLLGEPERVEGGGITFWRWADGQVTFVSGKVSNWKEPTFRDTSTARN